MHHICNSWLSVFRSIFEITQDDVLFLASPLTFDPSVVELFIALTSGASILIVPNAVKMMPLELSTALFSHHHVTVLQVGNNWVTVCCVLFLTSANVCYISSLNNNDTGVLPEESRLCYSSCSKILTVQKITFWSRPQISCNIKQWTEDKASIHLKNPLVLKSNYIME